MRRLRDTATPKTASTDTVNAIILRIVA